MTNQAEYIVPAAFGDGVVNDGPPFGEAWKGSALRRVNQAFLYNFGVVIGRMRECISRETTMMGEFLLASGEAEHYFAALALSDDSPLELSKPALQTVRGVVMSLRLEASRNPKRYMTQQERAGLANELQNFDAVFGVEANRWGTFMVRRKGLYHVNDLIDYADHVLPETLRSSISDEVLSDFRLAGRCLAFDLPTACGFHVVRATEALIHAYYVKVTANPISRKDRNWGAYVRNLNKHRKDVPGSRVDPKIVALIDQVREHHRNPVVHPENHLTADEAFELFNVAQSAISAVVRATLALS